MRHWWIGALWLAAAGPGSSPAENATMRKLTPVLTVESIEECLPFWRERLGFEQTMEVPHEGRLGFVALQNGPVEVMLQSRASVAAESEELARGEHRSTLYIEVPDLDALRPAIGDWPHAVPERETFYGTREIVLRSPAGNLVILSQPLEVSEPGAGGSGDR